MPDALIDILLFRGGYNTNIVLFCTFALGATAGLVGAFIFLRGRTLLSDAVSHATLPGVALGFLCAYALGIDGGRFLPALLIGAAVTAALSALAVQWIRRYTRLNDDVAIGSVLSVFYGAGIVLLSFIQRLEGAAQAGLDSFLLGQVTGTSLFDATVIAALSLVILLLVLLFLKDLCLLCFDKGFAQTIGQPVSRLDILLLGLMIAIVCTGLKTVGLILILALLIIPPVTARLWSHQFKTMLAMSTTIGASSAFLGAVASAYYANIPTGGAIVLVAGGMFFVSLFIAPAGGIIRLYGYKGGYTS
jgi:manganese/zinc/iron transport system permease protein